MEVSFLNMMMPKMTALSTVSFQACVNGEYLWCEISCEALYAYFGAGSMNGNDLLNAFHRGTGRMEHMARRYRE
jgi:hypothetical protein